MSLRIALEPDSTYDDKSKDNLDENFESDLKINNDDSELKDLDEDEIEEI